MSLDPIATTEAITESYLRYLSTTFRLRDGALQRQFEEALKAPGKFVKGPILEATPPYETGSAIESLITEGILSSRFRLLLTESLPLDRPLYQHQEEAIHKVVVCDRNIVIATATGSGKTEAFLVPVLNHLFQEEGSGTLGPGVRILLLYPMNALANDQMARMRNLLENYPAITFGRYTGETEETQRAARENYRRVFQRDPLRNELICRDQMRETPLHILLTNYAMLEYLLLRPADHVFFDGEHAKSWRFLIIDEAHTYAGAKGIEMAMLLRRLKDRVVEGEVGRLRCIATGATLGKGERDFPEVAQFAHQLFGERLEWVEGDPSRQDVIKAVRKRMANLSKHQWQPHPDLYLNWQRIVRDYSGPECISALVEAEQGAGIPAELLRRAASERDSASFLYRILKRDRRIALLRRALEGEPQYLDDITGRLLGDSSHAREQLVALVDLAARARETKNAQSLIPARYHLFVRAIEGAYLALLPERRLYLERHERIDVEGQPYAVFEMAACRQCGAAYLVGETQDRDGKTMLKQPGKRYFEHAGNLEFYLLLTQDVDEVPEDEDEAVSYGADAEQGVGDRYTLCAACGAVDRDTLASPLCDCDACNHVSVIKVESKDGLIHKCFACGRHSRGNLVWRFLTGTEATGSVLATALYQQIPPRREEGRETSQKQLLVEDAWSSTAVWQPLLTSQRSLDGEGRQLLVFSDSRQAAAFFAPYLNRTYSQILRRRLILKTVEENHKSLVEDRWRLQDLIRPLQAQTDPLGLFPEKSLQEQETEVWKWVLYELLKLDRRNSLEGLGCLGFSLVRPHRWRPPKPLMDDWGLSEDEVWLLFQILLDTVRRKGAILFPDHVRPEDEFFAPMNREYYIRGNGSNLRRHVSSWSPSRKGGMNARLHFLQRLARQGLGAEKTTQECTKVLRLIWERGLALHDSTSCWRDVFSAPYPPREGVVYRIKPTFWELRPGTTNPEAGWYYCDTCNSLTLLNLRDVCPTYRCAGRLRPCDPAEAFKENHYRRLYSEIDPIRLVAREHTAQLKSEAAAELQTQFVQGEVNVLSCSTTFELGVDVGELESVFMRNAPPSAANYVQRAGRAGRRTDSTAFALTFAQRRPHDLAHFDDPKRMVAGEIKPPHFKVANEKVVRRHVYATALAAFWKEKEYRGTFGSVESFFLKEGRNGPTLFADYLADKPAALRTSLHHIVPLELKQSLQLDGWGWTRGLFDEEEGVLLKASERVAGDVQELEAVRRRLIEAKRPSDYILRIINTLKKAYLINFLSRQNVIPKYGFPVDVVSLQVLHHADEARRLSGTQSLLRQRG